MDRHSAYISASHSSILHQTFVVLDILLYLQQIHLNTAYEGHAPDQANTPKSAAPWINVKQHYYPVPSTYTAPFFHITLQCQLLYCPSYGYLTYPELVLQFEFRRN